MKIPFILVALLIMGCPEIYEIPEDIVQKNQRFEIVYKQLKPYLIVIRDNETYKNYLWTRQGICLLEENDSLRYLYTKEFYIRPKVNVDDDTICLQFYSNWHRHYIDSLTSHQSEDAFYE